MFCAGLCLIAVASIARAGTYDLSIGEKTLNLTGSEARGMAINGSIPGPVLRFKEGEALTLNVTNTMDVDTSIHWHGCFFFLARALLWVLPRVLLWKLSSI